MRTHRRCLPVLLWLLASLAAAAQTPDFVVPVKGSFRFIAYGDVRFTDPAATDWSNAAYRRVLIAQIAKEKPRALVFVGDLVRKGSVVSDWEVAKAETAPWSQAGIRLLPVIGNHDSWGDRPAVNYFRHFPELNGRRWYTVQMGTCFFIMLESEPNKPGTEQWTWFRQQLERVPASADYLFVVLHHPPYTRSDDNIKGGGHGIRPEEAELAKLLEARREAIGKPIIVLAGHVHAYERYSRGGVTYIVTGGGGATPYDIPRQPGDAYQEPGPTYHFCRFSISRNLLKMQMVKLSYTAGKAKFSIRDSFEVHPPPKAAAAPK